MKRAEALRGTASVPQMVQTAYQGIYSNWRLKGDMRPGLRKWGTSHSLRGSSKRREMEGYQERCNHFLEGTEKRS